MPSPRVSIITPCYNVAPYVARMIASVRGQTFHDWEHVLVDDGSTDDTASIIRQAIADEPRARLVQQPNRGVCAARNEGYRASNPESEFVYFCDGDDMLAPEMLSKSIHYLETHPQAGLVFVDIQYIDEQDHPLPTPPRPRFVPTRFGIRALRKDETITPFLSSFCGGPMSESNCVVRRSVYERTPGWDENFGQGMEGECLLHVGLISELHFLPEPLYLYRQHERQHSRDQAVQEAARRRLLSKWRSMGGLTYEQRRKVDAAVHFFENRLASYIGIRAAFMHLRRGSVFAAVRFAGGAIRRYARSLLKDYRQYL